MKKVPMYISECSPARYRGKLLVLEMSIVVIVSVAELVLGGGY